MDTGDSKFREIYRVSQIFKRGRTYLVVLISHLRQSFTTLSILGSFNARNRFPTAKIVRWNLVPE